MTDENQSRDIRQDVATTTVGDILPNKQSDELWTRIDALRARARALTAAQRETEAALLSEQDKANGLMRANIALREVVVDQSQKLAEALKHIRELQECNTDFVIEKERLMLAYAALLKKYTGAQKSLVDLGELHSALIETHYHYRKWSTELLLIGVVGGAALLAVAIALPWLLT